MEIRILYLEKAEERYIFLYRPGREMEAISGLIKDARDPGLSLSWGDVHLAGKELMATRWRRGAQIPLIEGRLR